MYTMGFIETFMEIFNVNAAVAIIFFCGLVLFKTRKLDRDLLRARLFLNYATMQRTWQYIPIAGASFALNDLARFASRFTDIGDILSSYYVVELIQIIFLMVFIHAVYSWYSFISANH